MITGTQTEAKVSNPSYKSTSERMFWNLLPCPNTPNSDNRLSVLADVCMTEAEEVVKEAAPNKYCFGVGAMVRGKWAANVLSDAHMTMKSYPNTKKFLCRCITDGWFGCRAQEDEKFFAGVLQRWPVEETKEAADAIRQVIQMRFRVDKGGIGEPSRLARFFVGYTPTSQKENEICRTIFKAIGKYADVNDLIVLGQALNLLQGELRKSFYDFVENGI